MVEFESFEFQGARFYEKKTVVPLDQRGLTFFKGQNLDGMPEGHAGKKVTTSNGTGKTWLVQLLEGFIFGKNARGQLKKSVTPKFTGTLKFKDKQEVSWSFTWVPSLSKDAWTILKDGEEVHISHKPSDCQTYLQTIVGITKEEWHYFVHLDQQSLNILMRGKPTERRVYLEGFFAIDSFYTTRFDKYYDKLKKLKEKAEVIKENKIKLAEVQESLKVLPGEQWVRVQQDACEETLIILKGEVSQHQKDKVSYQSHIEGWKQYHSLFTELQGLDVDALKKEKELLVEEKILLEEKARKKSALKRLVDTKLTPHLSKEPVLKYKEPESPLPEPSEITEKELQLNKMREKLQTRQKLRPIVEKLNDLKALEEKSIYNKLSDADLGNLRNILYKDKSDMKDHLELLNSGGDVCPTCKQSLGFILGESSLKDKKEALRVKIKECDTKASEISELQQTRSQVLRVQQEQDTVAERYSQYPQFGIRIGDAEEELRGLKGLVNQWDKYNAEQKKVTSWKSTKEVLLAEAKAKGYPQLLEEEDSGDDICGATIRINSIEDDVRRFNKLEDLTTAVMEWKSLPELETLLTEVESALEVYTSRQETVTELRGSLKEQLSNVIDLTGREINLQKKVEDSNKIEQECRILDLVSKFYSPKGFKVYELKRRCVSLIERTNFWSKLFFQEPYEWSLSEDVDNLDFFIQPINDRSTDPYPVASLSSGEYNRASRALLFSQLELIPPNKKLNNLFLDEIEGNLDDAGIVAFTDEVLPTLKDTFKDRTIVIISHQNSIPNSGVIDHMWIAERSNRQTTLKTFPWYQRRRQQA
jgi:hypothetical protein